MEGVRGVLYSPRIMDTQMDTWRVDRIGSAVGRDQRVRDSIRLADPIRTYPPTTSSARPSPSSRGSSS